jgi:pyruvate formate lyase activating enzyme
MSVLGIVSDIQRYSLHDGPGIRTVIFLKSCPLSCQWCANPEAQQPHPELMFTNATCVACENCVSACPDEAITLIASPDQGTVPVVDWGSCNTSLACAKVCPTGTLTQVGKAYTIDEIVAIVQLDKAFYDRSNGGVTLSGGEPTSQTDFSNSILEACKEHGIHTTIETCGACEWEQLAQLLPFTDLIYFDVKHLDPAQHLNFTGAPNEQILANLARLIQLQNDLVIRLPLIPGYNDNDEHLINMATFLKSLKPGLPLELIPYHRLGNEKYARLGQTYPFEGVPPTKPEQLEEREQFLQTLGLELR